MNLPINPRSDPRPSRRMKARSSSTAAMPWLHFPLIGMALGILFLSLPTLTVARTCPPCGNTTVPYPLSTSPGCGDPGYPILCDTSTASLLFSAVNSSSPSPSNLTYPITRINPSTRRLIIQPAPFRPASTCFTSDFPNQGLALNSSLPFNITSSNTLMYLNCSITLLNSPLNCTASSPCRSYVAADPTAAPCRSGLCCTVQAGGGGTSYRIRTTRTGCSAYRSFVGLDIANTPPARWAEREGVELEWATPREPVCTTQADCEAGANATCAADPASPSLRRCFCVAPLVWDPFSGTCIDSCQVSGNCGGSNNAALIAGLTSGLAAALVVSILGFLLYRRQKRIKEAREKLAKEREEILNANNSSGRSARNFTGREMKRATANFSKDNLLGAGGYGEVFKGTLPDDTPIAVKVAKLGNTKSTDQILNEVRILSQVNHRSLVRLLGCCVELDQPLMVYEFIPNGTLYDHLHGGGGVGAGYVRRPPLPWIHRLSIAHQTAEGLAYLHFSAVPPIYHRDVKSSNILLDDKLNAKVADFGLSRLAQSDLSHISTCAQGTLGYLDPEYYRNYQLTDKSDVYSFGVVLLELLTSQKAIDFNRDPDDVNLAVYVQRRVEDEKIMEVLDPNLTKGASKISLDTMKALAFLAVGCLEEKRQNRPSMKEVAEEIEYIISLERGGVEQAPSA